MLHLRAIEYGTRAHRQMILLREGLLRRPLGLVFSPAILEQERADLLLAAFKGEGKEETLVACCILSDAGEGVVQLRQMAVQKELQGTGIGTQLMAFAEKEARKKSFHTMMLHARKTAVPFYGRLGYRVHGKEFLEVTLPHLEMRKSLA